MSKSTGKNTIANFVGSLSGPLISLVMTPFYLHKIGLEGLGLVGLMTLISTVLGVFVAGASKTYQRDLSTAQASALEDVAGLVKGGLMVFAGIGLCLGLLVLFFGHRQIRDLATGSGIQPDLVDRCLYAISFILALGVTNGALTSTLIALRDQVWQNLLGIAMSLLTAVACWFALTRWPRVDVFYLCQLGGALITLGVLVIRCRRVVIQNARGISSRSIRDAWKEKIRISGRLSLVLIVHEGLGAIIAQIDRLLVTSQFPLAALGSYNLGAAPARFTGIFTSPVNTVTYPELCSLVGNEASRQVIGEYLGRVTFVLFLLFAAIMIVLIPSSPSLLAIWLGSAQVPPNASECLTLISAGYLLLAVAGPFYNLTVACGKVAYGIPKNILSLMILPPLGILLGKIWGLPGIAAISVIYACICIGVCSVMAFRRHADSRSSLKWIAGDAIALLVASAFVAVLLMSGLSGWAIILASSAVSLVFFLAFLACYFGPSPSRWFHALETHRAPQSGPREEELVRSAP